MLIKNKKWLNVTVMSLVGFAIIILFEIIPDITHDLSLAYNYFAQKHKASVESDKQAEFEIVSRENKIIKHKMAGLVSVYDDKGNLSNIISNMDEEAKLANVGILSIRPDKVTTKENLYYLPLEVELSSSYERFYNYLRFLEQSSRVLVLNEANIQKKENSTDSLTIKAKFEVYLNL